MRTQVTILDGQTNEPVEAELFDEVEAAHFIEAQEQWRPLVVEAAQRAALGCASGPDLPRHWHWNWTSKAPDLGMLAYRFYGLECHGQLQGLMKVDTVLYQARLAKQKGHPLVYVDYLEVAPWNVRFLTQLLGQAVKFRTVGTRLLQAAAQLSIEEDFKGRVGLHSLPGSESFYLQAGMSPVERDPKKQDLCWMELTPEAAQRLTEERE